MMMAQLRSFPTSCCRCCSKKLFAAISISMSSNNVDAADVRLMTDIEVPVWPLQLSAPSFLNFFCKVRISFFLLSSSSQFSSATPIFFFYNCYFLFCNSTSYFLFYKRLWRISLFWSNLTNPKLPKCNSHNTQNSLQSKFLQKNPNVCLSVCLCPLQQNKGEGEEKERKKKKTFFSQTKCLFCVLFCTQNRKIFLCNNEPPKKKNQNQTMGVGFFSL